jgi:hypothetical protein
MAEAMPFPDREDARVAFAKDPVVQRSFVGSPWSCQVLRCLRMTALKIAVGWSVVLSSWLPRLEKHETWGTLCLIVRREFGVLSFGPESKLESWRHG